MDLLIPSLRFSLPAFAFFLLCIPTTPAQTSTSAKPTVAEALAFIDAAEKELNTLNIDAARAAWVEETYITDDTVTLVAEAGDRVIAR
jgi:peptidyl-dipeptidase A